MSIVKRFFSNLSWRFNNENDLSDVTWTLCYTSETFKYLFLRFFFPNVIFDKINSFTRELTKDDSRADFVIDNDGKLYVVECKISDKNHHFDQYVRAYDIPKENLGYIVNYYHYEPGFEVKTWEQFYDFIDTNLPEDESEKSVFEGYLEYLRNVCGIIKITNKMDLKGIYSLYGFNQILKSVINRGSDYFDLTYYNTDFKESYYGYKFKVEDKSNNIIKKGDIWLNVGVWFNLEDPVITIGVWDRNGWGKLFADELAKEKEYKHIYTRKSYFEDSTYYFEGSDRFYIEFKNAENPDEQKKVLCHFVDEVVEFYLFT